MRPPFRIINQPFPEMVLPGSGIGGACRGKADFRSGGNASRLCGSFSRLCGSFSRGCGGQYGKGASLRFRGGASTLRGEITDQGAATNLSSAALGDSEAARHRYAEKSDIRERRQIFPRRRSAIPERRAFIPRRGALIPGRQALIRERHALFPERHTLIPLRPQFIPASSLDVCEDLSSTLYRSRPLHRKEN
jgi:hypothetical protein